MTDDPKLAKRDELKRKFGINRLPLAVGPGWYPLVEQFLEEARVASELDTLEIDQIKEKFGELRIYHNGSGYLQRVESRLERVSAGICEDCGGRGRPTTTGDWHKTRCDRCDAADAAAKRALRSGT